jgi:hypothetical protein
MVGHLRKVKKERKMTKAEKRIREGFNYLVKDDLKGALRSFRAASSLTSAVGRNELHVELAHFLAYEVAKYLREQQKTQYGNANEYTYESVNSWKAWDDISIAAVLLAPRDPKANELLQKFLGRTWEGIRFIRRYAYDKPLSSWTTEDGKRYTRYTQTKHVQKKLGV